MKIFACAFAAALALSFSAQAGDIQPDRNGCYQVMWFNQPWLAGENCSHPALGDPDHLDGPKVSPAPPREPPPHECPYDKKNPS